MQDTLNHKKRIQIAKISTLDNLPLRGHLVCPKCEKQLTGSTSRGRKDYYYHCTASCGARFKAEAINDSFVNELRRFVPKPGMVELFKFVVNDIYSQGHSFVAEGRKDLLAKIQTEKDRLAKARKLLLDEAMIALTTR